MASQHGLVAKLGAEGLLGIGLYDGRGLAFKVLDGAPRAVAPAAVHRVRSLLGLEAQTPALVGCAQPPIANSRAEVVGELAVR
jgi:L-asparaginase II